MNLEIEKLRLWNESARHWSVRRSFLTHNWEKMDSIRLNSLSLCWTNNIFYGNRYAPKVTQIITECLYGMPKVSELLDAADSATNAAAGGRKRRISQERDETVSISNEKRLKLPAKFQPMVFHKGETKMGAETPQPETRAAPQYMTPAPPTAPAFKRAQTAHIKPANLHHAAVQKIKRALSRIAGATPYAVDIAARRTNEPLSADTYQCGENLIEIKNFIQSKRGKLFTDSCDIELFKTSKYVVVSLRGIELGYGFGKSARRAAFDNAEKNLRKNPTFVISALRLSGIRPVAQFTISDTNQNEELGYILPQHFTPVSQGGDGNNIQEHIKRIDQLTLFLHEGIINPYTIIDRSASLNRVTIEYRDEPDQTGNGEPSFRYKLFLGGIFIAEGSGGSKKDAKHDCCENAIVKMKVSCTVFNERVKTQSEGAVNLDGIKNGDIEGGPEKSTKPAKPDKGAMLMKLMGWSGGGLGKNETGRTDIVKHHEARIGHDKTGFGVDNEGRCQVTVQDAEHLIARYANSEFTEDLAFSSSLGKEERAVIHKAAQKYGLKSKSHGKNESRYLVVARNTRQKLLMLKSGKTHAQAELL